MKKKLGLTAMAGVLSLGVLAACGNDDTVDTENNFNDDPATEENLDTNNGMDNNLDMNDNDNMETDLEDEDNDVVE